MESQNSPKIIAIGGGKGGVGKSLISANIAILFAHYGRKTVAFDADFGCSNLHTCLGMGRPERSLADFVDRRVASLEETFVASPYPNLNLVSAHVDTGTLTDMHHSTWDRILKSMQRLPVDCVIIDLGAGSSREKIDIFLEIDQGIIVVTPEPTSVENAYSFLKNCIRRLTLQTFKNNVVVRRIVKEIFENPKETFKTETLLRALWEFKPEFGRRLQEELTRISPLLIMNMVREESDRRVGQGLEDILRQYLLLNARFIGYLPYEAAIVRSVRESKPIVSMGENSLALKSLKHLVGQINFINQNS
ncbi:P-loop NTPase [Chrysiogenes arsenatis]|uniref:P-loop NTPase n=1 Tax=Chrysiogenes arsenatis TaxID=309797 RepID=UPI00040C7E2A|nr:P-loop NTPase [Chrysiogenes arsenatis]